MANHTENYNLVKPTMAETADIRTLNGNMDTVDAIMHDTQVSMADAFDSTKSYAIREKCMYEFKLYQCIHPHTGPWDAEDFERVNAADTGGNYVEITPTYQSGLKIADTNIDGDQDEIDVPYFGGATAQENGTGGAVPAPTSSDVGKFLSSNGGWEIPSGGGGGTTVVPNPVGEPAEDLETVQIGNIIYNIPGNGGGSGSGYSEVNLWTNTTGAGNGQYTLDDSIDNYDFISVRYGLWGDYTGNTPLCECQLISVKDLQALHTDSKTIIFTGYGERVCYADFNGDTLTVTNSNGGQIVLQINGIKFGAGTNAEIIPITAGDGTTSRTFTFPKTPKFIKLYFQDLTLDNGWLVDSSIVWGQAYATTLGHRVFVETANASGGCIALTYPTGDKSVTITAGNAFQACNTVNGTGFMFVDYGGGSGSGGGYSETDLFVNTGSSNPSSIVMNDSIQNYDEIVFKVTRNAYGNTYKLQYRYLTSELELGDQIQCWCWGPNNEYFSYVLTAFDTFSNMAQGNALLCTKIIGIKH